MPTFGRGNYCIGLSSLLDFDPLGLPQRVAALVDGVEPSFLVRNERINRRYITFNLIRRQPTDLTPLPTTHRVEVVLTSGKALQMLPKCPCKPDAGWLAKSSRQESNLQPTDYKTVALPVELQEHVQEICL